jgi:O-antigen ligase
MLKRRYGNLAPAMVGTTAGTTLVLVSAFVPPMLAAIAVAGTLAVATIAAFPYWGYLLTTLIIPLERIGRFTDDSSMATVSLMRIVGMLTLGALLLHVVAKRRQILITFPGALYAAYFGVGILTLAHTSDFEFGIRSLSAMAGNLLFFVLVVNIVRTPAQARAGILCWLLMTTAIGVFTIYQWHRGDVIVEDRFNSTGERTSDDRFSTVLADAAEFETLEQARRALGTTSHPAVYAINVILALPFFAYAYRTTRTRWWRVAIAAAGLISCYNVVLTNTRAALMTMVIVLGLIAVMKLIRLRPATVAAAMLASALALPFIPGAIWERVLDTRNYTLERSETLRARLMYWEEGANILADHWLLGIGIGNQTELPRRLSSRVYMPPNSTAHNEYLQSLLETGLLGFPILAAFIFVLAQQARAAERRFRHADDLPTVLMLRAARVALLAVLVYALQVDVLHFPLKGWWLAMAVIAALYERRPRPQEVRHVAA